MKYTLHFDAPQTQVIRIDAECEAEAGKPFQLTLPYYRPGRYEKAAYFEHIAGGEAKDHSGNPVPFEKVSTHCWEIRPEKSGTVTFSYEYYANEQNAGSSWFGDDFIYINGVNFLVFKDLDLDSACSLHLDLQEEIPMAGSLQRKGNTLFAESYHEMVDSPFILSHTLQMKSYQVGECEYFLWFQGNCKPDWSKLLQEFKAFTQTQVALFGEIPIDQYHFLFIVPNYFNYHGVEHNKSTVIVLGPGYKLMGPSLYPELMGVSSHELFHTWNVKAIRPAEMQPYSYSGPQYSRLHFITEGVTTYYGDLMLLKSGVWSLKEYTSNFNSSNLARHYNNEGWKHQSLEQSSFESWSTGYKKGVPDRKISFYTKGSIVAFLLDFRIRKETENKYSLDNVIREMYEKFGKPGKGYSKADYQRIAESFSSSNLADFFADYIEGVRDVTEELGNAANYFGFEMQKRPFNTGQLALWGFKTKTDQQRQLVIRVLPGSPAAKAGLRPDDEIVAVNGLRIGGDLKLITSYFLEEKSIKLHYFHQSEMKEVQLNRDPQHFYGPWEFKTIAKPSVWQSNNLKCWSELNV